MMSSTLVVLEYSEKVPSSSQKQDQHQRQSRNWRTTEEEGVHTWKSQPRRSM